MVGEDLREEKREDLRGGKALGGKGGKGSQQSKGGRSQKGKAEDLVKKGHYLNRERCGKDLREEREKIGEERPTGKGGKRS